MNDILHLTVNHLETILELPEEPTEPTPSGLFGSDATRLRHTGTRDKLESDSQDAMPGLIHSEDKQAIKWAKTGRRVFTREKSSLAPMCHTVVPLTFGPGEKLNLKNNDVLIQPKQNNKFKNKKGIFLHPGAYKREGDQINVLVTYLGKKTMDLPKYMKVGHVYEGLTCDTTTVNTLDHRAPTELSPTELVERRAYVVEYLNLSKNSLLKDKKVMQEKLIQIFLYNWGAISVGERGHHREEYEPMGPSIRYTQIGHRLPQG